MDILSATEARTKLYRLIDETAESHKPVVIKGQRNSAVLISLEDWNGIQETLYLTSIPDFSRYPRDRKFKLGYCPLEASFLHW